MKKALFFTAVIGGSFLCSPVFSQQKGSNDSLGLPGDNLNLYGVLALFQKSETLEEFEKKLNSEDSKVNNLDLNGNSKIDYISVKDNVKGTAHAIVLQVAINEKETQDVAVIEVEKGKNDKVQIQIVGDEQLYGKDYIIEPQDEATKSTAAGTPNPGYNGGKSGNSEPGEKKNTTVTNTTNNYYTTTNNNNVNDNYRPVNDWGIIHFLFFPSYVVYVSPWSWGYYPGYWNPWAPLYWHSYYYDYYYPHYDHYYGYYHRSNYYRNTEAHGFYEHRRTTSATVNQRRESGEYRKTYSRPDLASKPANGSRSTVENKKTNSNVDNNRPTKTGSNDRPVKERSAAPVNNNNHKADRPKGNNNQSQPAKQSAPKQRNSSPAQRSSGSKSGSKESGGGKKR